MIAEEIVLQNSYPVLQGLPSPTRLCTYCRGYSPELGEKKYPALIICPGGAYQFVSEREGEPIALAFLAHGIQCFVLHYHTAPVRYPMQLLELGAAISHVRANAEKYQIDPQQISVMGFSAGGHLASSYATHWADLQLAESLEVTVEALRPNGAALCYGVLSGGEKTHEGSMRNLLGDSDTPEMRRFLSFEHSVTEATPPAFLWHTFADGGVPVENSLMAASALAAQKIPFEMHIYPDGAHGLALSNWLTERNPENLPPRVAEDWVAKCAAWLLRQAGLGKQTRTE